MFLDLDMELIVVLNVFNLLYKDTWCDGCPYHLNKKK